VEQTKPKAVVGKVEQAQEGKTHRYFRRKNGTAVAYTICCDCGLTHLETFTPRKRYIAVKVWRDEKLTRKFRGKRNIVKQ
jgi:hypothetical protein